jgi:chromosomal replication initiator protein
MVAKHSTFTQIGRRFPPGSTRSRSGLGRHQPGPAQGSGPAAHSQWIKPIQLGTICKETGTLDLFLPTEFSANWVADRFADRLSLAWKIARPDVRQRAHRGAPGRRQLPELRLGGRAATGPRRPPTMRAQAPAATASSRRPRAGSARSARAVGLDPSLTFATFVTGTANVLACNAAQRMAASGNAAVLAALPQGATGQGKTHLLHAIGHAYLAPSARAHLLLLGRALHGRIRPGAAPEPDDRVQGPAARLRPAAGR